MITFVDSLAHLTTDAQVNTKIAQAAALGSGAPVAGTGFMGSPGISADDRIYNLGNLTTIEISAYIKFFVRDGGTVGRLLQLWNGSGCQVQLNIKPDGHFDFYRGANTTFLDASLANVVTFNIHHHFYCKIVCSDTEGSILVKIDGSEVFAADELDTSSGGTAEFTQLHTWGNGVFDGNMAKTIWSMMSFASVAGDIPGQPRVACAFATADGFHTAFTPVGSGADHKDRIKEVTPDDTNYNSCTAAGQKDSYLYANNIPVGSIILAVAPVPRVSKSDGSVREVRSFYREGGVDYPGATKAVPGSPGYLQDIWMTNPATPAVRFTPAQLNAPAEIGLEGVT